MRTVILTKKNPKTTKTMKAVVKYPFAPYRSITQASISYHSTFTLKCFSNEISA